MFHAKVAASGADLLLIFFGLYLVSHSALWALDRLRKS